VRVPCASFGKTSIAITAAAYDAICATLPLGSVAVEAGADAVRAKSVRISHEGVAAVLRVCPETLCGIA
jgi:hypothetical protein